MDDKLSMENMKLAYDIVYDTISDLNNKSFQLISIIGVMFTLQVTILSPMCKGLEKIFLILSLIGYVISAILFIKSCFIKNYKVYPTNESVKYHYEENVSMDDYYSGSIGDYYEVINYNRNVIDKQAKDVKFGFYFFVIGLILTLMTIISMVIIWVMKMRKKKQLKNNWSLIINHNLLLKVSVKNNFFQKFKRNLNREVYIKFKKKVIMDTV